MLDFVRRTARSFLGVAGNVEHEAERHSPIEETHRLEQALLETVEAMSRAAESVEKQIAVMETLASSLPPLTASVQKLTDQLSQLLEVAAPLEATERDISRLRHPFRRGGQERPASRPN